jgi:D-alanyl-D-alanine carboxypeptidase
MAQRSNSPRLLAVLLALALIATSCGSSADAADATTSSPATTAATTTQAPPETEPESTEAEDDKLAKADPVEARAALIEEITAVLVEWQERGGMPAASLSVRLPGQEPIEIATGVTNITTGQEATTNDFYRIGSITKPMTAAIVLQLVDEGLIELDEPVQTYIPGWLEGYQYASEITIRQLMNHTNGLIEYALSPIFFAVAGTRLDQPYDPAEIVEWLARQPPLFPPGEQYSYETGGFLTLGTVIEQVTGNSAAAEMRARIFKPAGAENIYLTPEEFPPTPTINGYGRAEMYVAGTVLVGRADEAKLTIKNESVVDVSGLPQEVLQSAGWTGGGNEARLESVSAVMKAIFDGTILTNEQIEVMTEPTLDVTYGLGIDDQVIDGVRVLSHGGGVPGFRSQGNYLPELDVSWAVSVNLVPLPEGSKVGDLRRALLPILVAAVE